MGYLISVELYRKGKSIVPGKDKIIDSEYYEINPESMVIAAFGGAYKLCGGIFKSVRESYGVIMWIATVDHLMKNINFMLDDASNILTDAGKIEAQEFGQWLASVRDKYKEDLTVVLDYGEYSMNTMRYEDTFSENWPNHLMKEIVDLAGGSK